MGTKSNRLRNELERETDCNDTGKGGKQQRHAVIADGCECLGFPARICIYVRHALWFKLEIPLSGAGSTCRLSMCSEEGGGPKAGQR